MFENGVVQAGGRTAVLCMLSSVVTDSLGPHGQRSLEKNAGESACLTSLKLGWLLSVIGDRVARVTDRHSLCMDELAVFPDGPRGQPQPLNFNP